MAFPRAVGGFVLLGQVVGFSSAVEPLPGWSLAPLGSLYGEALYHEAYDGRNPYNIIKGRASIYCFWRVPERAREICKNELRNAGLEGR
jgi:hypothetical protein